MTPDQASDYCIWAGAEARHLSACPCSAHAFRCLDLLAETPRLARAVRSVGRKWLATWRLLLSPRPRSPLATSSAPPVTHRNPRSDASHESQLCPPLRASDRFQLLFIHLPSLATSRKWPPSQRRVSCLRLSALDGNARTHIFFEL